MGLADGIAYENEYNNITINPSSKWKFEVDKINKCPQRQDSATEQLKDLIYVSNKLGFYDASDVIKGIINSK